jgi:hypothetical protein
MAEKEQAKATPKPKVEAFFRDVVDVEKDPGDRWVIGKRLSEVRKRRPKGSKSLDIDIPEKDREQVEVALILRRIPYEIAREYREIWVSHREVKDAFGNARDEEYWETERLNQMIHRKCLWMWLDTENLWVEVGDEEAANMYIKGHIDAGKTAPAIKPGDTICIDGILNDEIKLHLLDRFNALKSKIVEAEAEYSAAEQKAESRLRKNSRSG